MAAFKSTQTNYVGKPFNFVRKNEAIPKSTKDVASLLKDSTVVPWSIINGTNVTIITNGMEYRFSGTIEKDGTNFMGLIVFSIALGIVLNKLGEDGRPLLDFFRSWFHVVMMLVSWIMWFSPFGILCLIAGSLAEVEDILDTFKDLGSFLAVYFVGCFIQAFILYPLLYLFFVRKNPFRYLSGIVPAMITAFGTSSSSATLPVTIRCVTENNKVDPRVAHFCLPIGATCNMDAAALYYAIVVLFMANLEHMYLNLGEIIMTALVAVFVSAGATGIPNSGLTYTILCLEAVGVPIRLAGLVLTVDWITDRVATVNNIMGDAYGAGIINCVSTDLQQILDDEPNGNVKDGCANGSRFHTGEKGITNETRF